MSRTLLGHERTRARRALAILSASHPDPRDLARLLGLKCHTVAPLLDGRARPQRCFAEAAARITPPA